VSKAKPKSKLTPPLPGTVTLTGRDLADAQAVLPLAVCNAVDSIHGCIDGQHQIEKDFLDDVRMTLLAGAVAANIGGPGDPAPLWFVLTNDRRTAVREIVSQWGEWCRNEARDHAAGIVLDGGPRPDAARYWTKQAETAERVVETIDAGRWGPTEEEATA
jgi:hypothetical protein